jgi:hypothetical protein
MTDDRVIPPAELYAVALRDDIQRVLDHAELERDAAAAEMPAEMRAELDEYMERERREVDRLRAALADLLADHADPLGLFATMLGRELSEQERDDLSFAVLPSVADRTKALAKRPGHVAIDNTIARSPLTLVSEIRGVSGRPASAAHKVLTALFVKRYAEQESRDGWIALGFAETCHLLGYKDRGERQYEAVREIVLSMQGCVVPREWVTGEGEERVRSLNVVVGTDVPKRARRGAGSGVYLVQLGDILRRRIDAARFTYLRDESIRRLRRASPRSETPLLLWMFLETQRLPWSNGWPIFRAPEGATDIPLDRRPLAEILTLHSKRHDKTVTRIRAAAKIVVGLFPEYLITVDPTDVATMYQVYAIRRDALESVADRVAAIEAATCA